MSAEVSATIGHEAAGIRHEGELATGERRRARWRIREEQVMAATINAARAWWTYKYNRLLHETGNVVGRSMGKATDVWIKITHRCETRCQMCNIWKTPNRLADELTTEEWKAVLDDLRSWLGPYRVSFIGGEPFARKDLIDLFAYCTKIGLSTAVITRGVGVGSREIAKRVIDSGLGEYHVSIEGLRPEIHDHVIPPKGSLGKALDGLQWLNELRMSEESPMKIVIKTIIMGFNKAEILPIVDWVMENRFDEIKFQPIEQTIEEEEDPAWYRRSELWPQDREAVERVVEIIDELIRRRRAGVPIHNPETSLENARRYFLDPEAMYRPVKQHILETYETTHERNDGWMEIWHDGNVHTSWKKPPIGNVRGRSIRDVWRQRPHPHRVVRVFGLLR
ncbi:MAG: radical SAM/SPASM domain-containing protein [Candidatus Rokuibacteriota bacterium]